jgi:hypothetical protein
VSLTPCADFYRPVEELEYSIEGGDHVTMTGHVRAGMGYRNQFQTENNGLLTQQTPLPMGCALSHMRDTYIHML